MTRLKVVVEGQTEEVFVKQVLAPHLRAYEVYATPIILGGGGSFGKALRTIRLTLSSDPGAYCSTMFASFRLSGTERRRLSALFPTE